MAVRAWPAHAKARIAPALVPDGDPGGNLGHGHDATRNGARAYGRGKLQHDDRLTTDVATVPEDLKHLAREIIQLCDANPAGTVLCANLPRQYKQRFRKALDFKQYGFLKMSALLAKLPGIQFEGTHRAKVSHKANADSLFNALAPPPRCHKPCANGAPLLSDNGLDNLPPLNDAPPPPPSPPHAAYISVDAPSWKAIVAGEAAAPRSGESFDTDDEHDPTDGFLV